MRFGRRNEGQAARVDKETRRVLKLAVFSPMRVTLQTSTEHSVVVSCEMMISITVHVHDCVKNDPLILNFSPLSYPLMQLNITREPGDIVQ